MRRRDVPKLRELETEIEVVLVVGAMEHLGHPPREVLGTPDSPQTGVGVRVEACDASRLDDGAGLADTATG